MDLFTKLTNIVKDFFEKMLQTTFKLHQSNQTKTEFNQHPKKSKNRHKSHLKMIAKNFYFQNTTEKT